MKEYPTPIQMQPDSPSMEAVLEWIEHGRDEIDRDIRRAIAVAWIEGAMLLTPLESGDMLCKQTDKPFDPDSSSSGN
jgi:hypothetical protein